MLARRPLHFGLAATFLLNAVVFVTAGVFTPNPSSIDVFDIFESDRSARATIIPATNPVQRFEVLANDLKSQMALAERDGREDALISFGQAGLRRERQWAIARTIILLASGLVIFLLIVVAALTTTDNEKAANAEA